MGALLPQTGKNKYTRKAYMAVTIDLCTMPLSSTDISIIDCAVYTATYDDTTAQFNTSNKALYTLHACKMFFDNMSEKYSDFIISTSILMVLSPQGTHLVNIFK